jgi:hypothetical protein
MEEIKPTRKITKKQLIENNTVYYESLKKHKVFSEEEGWHENGTWEKNGRQYDLKGLDNLLRGNQFEFIKESEVEEDIREYRKKLEEQKQAFKQN